MQIPQRKLDLFANKFHIFLSSSFLKICHKTLKKTCICKAHTKLSLYISTGLLPEALRTKCGKCSNNQKEAALRVIKNLYTRYPVHYNELREKWDASGEYHRKFEEYLSEEQFNNINGG